MQKPNLNLATPTPVSQSLVGIVVIATISIWVIAIFLLGYSIFAKKVGLSQKLNSFINFFDSAPSRQKEFIETWESGKPSVPTPNESTTSLPTSTISPKSTNNPVVKKKVIPTPTQVKYNQYVYPTSSIKTGSYVLPTYPPFEAGNSDFAKKVESEQARMHEEFEKMKAEICAKSPSFCD